MSILFLFLLPALLLFWAFSYDRQVQFLLVVLMALCYLVWAVIFHRHELHPKLLIEYALVAVFGCSLIYFLLFFR